MASYIEGVDRAQATLFPDRLDDFVDVDNPVRVVDAFVDALDLRELGFARAAPASTGRPGYHPGDFLVGIEVILWRGEDLCHARSCTPEKRLHRR
jgi:hypothetical protein